LDKEFFSAPSFSFTHPPLLFSDSYVDLSDLLSHWLPDSVVCPTFLEFPSLFALDPLFVSHRWKCAIVGYLFPEGGNRFFNLCRFWGRPAPGLQAGPFLSDMTLCWSGFLLSWRSTRRRSPCCVCRPPPFFFRKPR